GWNDAGGIEGIQIFNSLMTGGCRGIEVDHLQYALVPEPSTYALFLVGIVLVGCTGKRRMQARRDIGACPIKTLLQYTSIYATEHALRTAYRSVWKNRESRCCK